MLHVKVFQVGLPMISVLHALYVCITYTNNSIFLESCYQKKADTGAAAGKLFFVRKDIQRQQQIKNTNFLIIILKNYINRRS